MMTIFSSAKINLTLDILAQRADGYHELQSVVHAVGLWDELRFDFAAPTGLHLTCNREELCGEGNLCMKAVRRWLLAAQNKGWKEPVSLHIHLEKHIPSGAGLGGGSGNAAATLQALNTHFARLFSEDELLEIASKIGADVPLFLRGGCALMEGIGEKLSPLPTLGGWLVIVQPRQELSTPAVYKAWDEMSATSHLSTARLLNALKQGDLRLAAQALGNDLARAAQRLGLEVETLKNALLDAGALGAEMTGSGSAVFGLFSTEETARQAAAQIETQQNALRLKFNAAVPLCSSALRVK